MSYAVCMQEFELPEPDQVHQVIEQALKEAKLRRFDDYITKVILLATPAYSEIFDDILHQTVTQTQCMNVWGGCVGGIMADGKLLADRPGILIAVFGQAFEAGQKFETNNLRLYLAQSDLDDAQLTEAHDKSQAPKNSIGMGLLSYGANYANLPKSEHGRIDQRNCSRLMLKVDNPLLLLSEGLEFLSEPQEVTEANGLFLLKVADTTPTDALNCPDHQTKPIGLRLFVDQGEESQWIPVMNVLADGTLGLAAPLSVGQRVQIARRFSDDSENLETKFQRIAANHFPDGPPRLGIIMSGLERTSLCHPEQAEMEELARAFPETSIIGIVGQANWNDQDGEIKHPPMNNRLTLCLFNAPESNQDN